MKLINIPFLWITMSLLTGILIGHHFEIQKPTLFLCLLTAIFGLGASWFRSKKIGKSSIPFSIATIITFAVIGIALVILHNPQIKEDHYIRIIKNENIVTKEYTSLQFFIEERLKPTSYYHRYLVSVHLLEGKKTSGNMMLLIPKKDSKTPFVPGDAWIGRGTIRPVPKALNPNQFDYATYLAKQYIHYQFIPLPNQIIKTGEKKWSLPSFADHIRTKVNKQLSLHEFSTAQLSMINALLLGQRQDIDKDVLQDYKDAGAIHILAVSGLHVGVLMLIFNFLLKPLDRWRKKGKIIKTILVVLFLWSYAVLTGLSPSVLRAVTMFSFLLIGLHIRSKTSAYNSLLVSLFVLLCFQPMLLFSVGFQLSYLAVFAIIWIQPFLASYYIPKFKIDKILWETFTVTIAAQLGVLPLTLFYFHQFPSLFFITNLAIIPALGMILGFGIIVIILAVIGCLPKDLAYIFGKCIDAMNGIVQWVAAQDHFLISNIKFSWPMLITSYVLIVLLVITLQKFSTKKATYLAFATIVLVGILLIERKLLSQKEELFIFHQSGKTTLGLLQNRTLRLYKNDHLSKNDKRYLLQNYLIENNAKLLSEEDLKNVYTYKNKTILIIDESQVYNLDSFYPDILLLSNSPKVHLDRVIQVLRPKQIIADGSNWKNLLDIWERTCHEHCIPFYRTDVSGAFKL